uniref:Uncharacterized protein n=1 Tax=Anguilla anguilla TaxID=7936 RepID=A0A0E9UJ07_ANGAN
MNTPWKGCQSIAAHTHHSLTHSYLYMTCASALS